MKDIEETIAFKDVFGSKYLKFKEKINYTDGKINGLFQKWYDNGNKELDINYTDDQINGLYLERE